MGSAGPQDGGSSRTLADVSLEGELPRSQEALGRGAQIGRYHVLERIGAGGMGVVYAAYDPDLDRRVAIKVLQQELSGRGSRSDGRTLLLREAQAMARLSHPNVVAVHDVGVHRGAVFLAMEFVQGTTLRQWSKSGAHPWRGVLDVFVAAGRGLAAAHEVGLVHRDFKPDNVMLSEQGGVKVTDFGLARLREEHVQRAGPTDRAVVVPLEAMAELSRESLQSLTQTGAIMGTPAYMAPEQHLGLGVDARSDQFSFCVALYEGLYGRRPFVADAGVELAMKAIEGRIDEPPAGTKVPGWLRQVIVRGLAPRPDARWPSMTALLAELARDPGAARRRRFAALGLVGVLGTGALATRQFVLARDEPCSAMQHHLVDVWDPAARARVEQAVFATGVGFAQTTWERVEHGLDVYADAWIAAREDACRATQVRGEQSAALMDLRMECLDGRLRDLRAQVAVLADADETVVQNAVALIGGLPTLEPCADANALREEDPLPADPHVVAQIAALEQRIADSEALGRAGKYAEALAIAREVVDAAEPLGHAPLHARALRRRGVLEHVMGDETAAELTLQSAFFLAVRHELDEVAALSANELVTLVGENRNRPVEGRRWAEHAAAYADRVGNELLQASVLYNLAGIAHREGKFDEARATAEEVLAVRERVLGVEHEGVIPSLNQLGLIASDTGRFAEAEASFSRGLAIARTHLGADHPDLARFINNLAKLAWRRGDFVAAKAAFAEALQLQAAALGPDHRNVAQLENNLAAVAESMGDHDDARHRFEHALAIWQKALGPEHPTVADALNNLAVVASASGDLVGARAYDERALAIREATMPADHPDLAQNYANLGTDLYRLHDYEQARALHERALKIYETKLEPGHDDIALTLTSLGSDLLALDDPRRALPLLERAWRMREGAAIDPLELATTRWALARALYDSPVDRDRPRAIGLAQQARAAFVGAPPSVDNVLTEIDARLSRWAKTER